MLPKISLMLSGFTALLFLGGILLANKEIIAPSLGMALYALGGLLGFAGALLAIVVLLKTGAYPVAMLGFLGILPFLAVLAPAIQGMGSPMINDISTDLEDPPVFTHAQTLPENAGRDMAFPAGNAVIIREGYPNLHPLQTTNAPAQAYQLALSVARKTTRWELTRTDEAAGVIEGVATTRLFRWRDDFIIRIRPTEDGGSIIDMRSKSRDGKGDLGANAHRIRQYFRELVDNIVASS